MRLIFRLAKRLANIGQTVDKINGFQSMGHDSTNDQKDLTTKEYDHLYKKKEES
jgi:hypothetical protein